MYRFIKKLVLFLIIITIAQQIIWSASKKSYYTQLMKDVNDFAVQKTDVIYFGDSILTTIDEKNDNDKTPLFLMVKNAVGPYSFGMVQRNSLSPLIFSAFTDYMKFLRYTPKYIIVPVNLHYFSAMYGLHPQNQFNDERIRMKYIVSPFAPFADFIVNFLVSETNMADERKYQNAPVYDRNTYLGTAPELDQYARVLPSAQQTEKFLIYTFMKDIDENNPQLKSLMHIAETYNTSSTKVIFYITPVDYETGVSHLGKRFLNQLRRNTDFIKNKLETYNARVLDFSLSLQADSFSWSSDVAVVNGHINEKGRKYLSAQIGKEIQK